MAQLCASSTRWLAEEADLLNLLFLFDRLFVDLLFSHHLWYSFTWLGEAGNTPRLFATPSNFPVSLEVSHLLGLKREAKSQAGLTCHHHEKHVQRYSLRMVFLKTQLEDTPSRNHITMLALERNRSIFCMPVCLHVSTQVHMCVCMYIMTYVRMYGCMYPSVFLSVCLSIHPSIHPSIHLSIYLPIHPSTYLPV